MNSLANLNEFKGNDSFPNNSSVCPFSSQINIAITYCVVVVLDVALSIPAHVGVVWLLLHTKGGLRVSDVFTLHSSLAELVNCVIIIFSLFDNFDQGSLSPAFNFFFGFILVGRPLFHCCICVERYLAVVHPIVFLKYKALRYRVACLALVWIITLVWSVQRVFYMTYNLLLPIFVSVLVVDALCSFAILRALKQPGPGDGEREMNRMKRRAFTTILVILLMAVINYIPLIIAVSISRIFSWPHNDGVVFPSCFIFSVLASFLHPVFYLSKAGKLPCIKSS